MVKFVEFGFVCGVEMIVFVVDVDYVVFESFYVFEFWGIIV